MSCCWWEWWSLSGWKIRAMRLEQGDVYPCVRQTSGYGSGLVLGTRISQTSNHQQKIKNTIQASTTSSFERGFHLYIYFTEYYFYELPHPPSSNPIPSFFRVTSSWPCDTGCQLYILVTIFLWRQILGY